MLPFHSPHCVMSDLSGVALITAVERVSNKFMHLKSDFIFSHFFASKVVRYLDSNPSELSNDLNFLRLWGSSLTRARKKFAPTSKS